MIIVVIVVVIVVCQHGRSSVVKYAPDELKLIRVNLVKSQKDFTEGKMPVWCIRDSGLWKIIITISIVAVVAAVAVAVVVVIIIIIKSVHLLQE